MKTVPVQRLKLDDIHLDPELQPRAELSQEVVEEYQAAIAEGVKMPPVVVFDDGEKFWLADGYHRWHAHHTAETAGIDAQVYEGSRVDAILYSVGANASHGLRRTNADKQKAIATLLRQEGWEKKPSREIARQCAVHEWTVRNHRANLSAGNPQIDETRIINRGDSTYVMNVGKIGKKGDQPAESMPRDPNSRGDAVMAGMVDLPVEPDLSIDEDAETEPVEGPGFIDEPEGQVEADASPGEEDEPAEELVTSEAPSPASEKPKKEHTWTQSELDRRKLVEEGQTVVANFRCDHALIAWAVAEGLFVRADRKSPWGNPFEMDDGKELKDGDRATVIRNYEKYYLPHKPSLKRKMPELSGKVLGCWCHPDPCHCHVLVKSI